MSETRAPAGGATTTADLPDWYPGWARNIAELYFSGTTSMFALHGNTWDLTWMGSGDRYGTLAEFLAEQLFGRRLGTPPFDEVARVRYRTGSCAQCGLRCGRVRRARHVASPQRDLPGGQTI